MQQGLHLNQQRLPLHAAGGRFVDQRHDAFAVGLHQRLNQRQRLVVIQRAEHLAHRLGSELPVAAGNRLIGQAEGVAQAAVGGAGQQLQGARLVVDLLFVENMLKLLADLIHVQRLEMKLQAAGEDRHRQLLRIGSRQQELNVRRWLFKGLQQGVKAVARQHMHFVYQVDFEAATGRRVLDVIQQVAGIFNLGTRGGVNLNQIDKAPLLDFAAVVAHAARRRSDAGLAVQPLRQQTGNRGLSDAAGAGKEIRMVNAS